MGFARSLVVSVVVAPIACGGSVSQGTGAAAAPAAAPSCPAEKPGVPPAPYVPSPAPGSNVALPDMPRLSPKPLRVGEDFTVWGASYSLRSRFEHEAIAGRSISVSGYIVETNLADAPRCAVHATGKADPAGCSAPVPTFWLGDEKTSPVSDSIKVMGWASNYAQLYDAIVAYQKKQDVRVTDGFWGMEIPNPLPAIGAKVRVRGSYQAKFEKATTGIESDPVMGVITYEAITVLEPAPRRATLPGMRP